MAELILGDHCSIDECKQLDYLPCVCNGCGRVFCKVHMCYEAHSCARDDLKTVETIAVVGEKSVPCSFQNCKQRELTKITCEHCAGNFCLKHRHQVDHKCKAMVECKERLTETARHVQDVISKSQKGLAEKKAGKKPISERSRALAAKVALMKMKQKAGGDSHIPDVDRVFFEVTLPRNHHTLVGDRSSKITQCALYFDRNWAVGRAIDFTASSKGLTNNNNKAGAAKLRLFDASTGVVCPSNKTFSSLICEQPSGNQSSELIDSASEDNAVKLFNGSSLILEYVEDNVLEIEI